MRKEGFYWVKFKHHTNWQVARWNGVYWYNSFNSASFEDDDCVLINEKCIEEPK